MSAVIFLHGASSAGKTVLASAIRATAEDGFLFLSLDHFRDSGALRPGSYQDWPAARDRFFEGFHHSIGAFARAGNDLIIEHILDDPRWFAQLRAELDGHHLLFVGVHTPLTVLNNREATRGDRPIGSAARDFERIHQGLTYDIEVAGDAPADLNALKILAALNADGPADRTRSAFFGPEA